MTDPSAEVGEELRRLAFDTPHPVHEVLRILICAADHLLRDHNCDIHGWETVDAAAAGGREILRRLGLPEPERQPCAHSDIRWAELAALRRIARAVASPGAEDYVDSIGPADYDHLAETVEAMMTATCATPPSDLLADLQTIAASGSPVFFFYHPDAGTDGAGCWLLNVADTLYTGEAHELARIAHEQAQRAEEDSHA